MLQHPNSGSVSSKRVELAVVADPYQKNKVLLQDASTRNYFQGVERWTSNVKDALSFVDIAEALHICRYLGIKNVQILTGLNSADVEPLPCVA